MTTRTFIAVKVFSVREETEKKRVLVTDENHPYHLSFATELLKASEDNRAPRLPDYWMSHKTEDVPTGRKVLGGMQRRLAEYPEPFVRMKDPQCGPKYPPVNCNRGWHVPFIESLWGFANLQTVVEGAQELWVVRVSGRHSFADSYDNKVAFEYMEMCSKLSISDAAYILQNQARQGSGPIAQSNLNYRVENRLRDLTRKSEYREVTWGDGSVHQRLINKGRRRPGGILWDATVLGDG